MHRIAPQNAKLPPLGWGGGRARPVRHIWIERVFVGAVSSTVSRSTWRAKKARWPLTVYPTPI